MRLMYCHECKAVSKVEDYTGRHDPLTGELLDPDPFLQEWIDRHMHGLSEETHPGATPYVLDDSQIDPNIARRSQFGTSDHSTSPEDQATLESKAFAIVRDHIVGSGRHVAEELRDEVKDDAMSCWNKHNQPEYPGKMCKDYQSGSKLLGRKNMPKEQRAYLCTFCPYQVGIEVEKRWRAGGYKL